MNRRAAALALLLAVAPTPSLAQDAVTADALSCGGALDDRIDFRITYGPFWDGAWRVTALHGTADTPPRLVFESIDFAPAAHAGVVAVRHERAAGGSDLRALRRATGVMIAEIQRYAGRDEVPEQRDQLRPLTVQLNGASGVLCADGYANWPRIPGAYYFSAVELLADWVQHPAGRDPWSAVRLQLQQIRAPWQ
ncbi:MAG: hypothetical protein WD081_00610 [Gammaproteobacteria bacterium]